MKANQANLFHVLRVQSTSLPVCQSVSQSASVEINTSTGPTPPWGPAFWKKVWALFFFLFLSPVAPKHLPIRHQPDSLTS